ncbi:DNA (cytosine-5)-methyltransferase 3-like isoform X4 [Pteropus medius]|uniref:DNA (cytosine-5)-methyltransferase 3-like isoform X4 n=1 Tax=Pteropus vampyrus TaxID=132908 RepID=UPI00196AC6B7|nr:DNA (cytosine-5)-methyltransferase 3-like isoform X4 [Pteropus giganteus]
MRNNHLTLNWQGPRVGGQDTGHPKLPLKAGPQHQSSARRTFLQKGRVGVTVEVLDPEVDCSMDVILVGSSELSAPPSPEPCRDLIAHEVKVNQRDIEDLCICCGSFQVHTQHPLFEGGMCAPCKDTFLDCLFLYDDDGYQSYCSICCSGETLLICENPDCTRCYCFECVDTLVGPGTSGKVQALSNWVCFLCLPFPSSGLLRRRAKWRGRLKAFYDREVDSPLEMYKTVPVWKREPVRVLSLFGDIKAELASLGFLESGSGPGRLKHLDDVTNTVRKDVEQWGPFDLVYGATPPFGQACDRPPGWYLFQFHRVLQYARPGGPRPFFWMFVDNLVLTEDDRAVASRFLEADPVTIRDACGRALQDAVHVWSNIPAALRPASPRGIVAAGSGQTESKAPHSGASQAGEELFSPPERIFQVFFNRTHFLCISLEVRHPPHHGLSREGAKHTSPPSDERGPDPNVALPAESEKFIYHESYWSFLVF